MNADELRKRYEPKQTAVLPQDRQLTTARFSPCGQYLVGAGYDALVHRWKFDGEDLKPIDPLRGHNGWVQAVAFAPKEQTLFTVDSWGQLAAWDYTVEKPQPKWSVKDAHDGWIQAVAVSPDGKQVATCGRDQRVCVFDAASGKKTWHLDGHQTDVFCLAFHPTQPALVSGDLSGVVKQWDLAAGKHVRDLDAKVLFTMHRLQDCGGVRVLAFTPDGKLLGCGGTRPKNGGNIQGVPTIRWIDFETGKSKQDQALGTTNDVFITDIVFLAADDVLLSTTCGDPGRGKLIAYRIGDEKPFYENTKMANCHGLALHPDGHRFAVVTTSKGSNGNGRRLDKDGNYPHNSSPIHLFALAAEG